MVDFDVCFYIGLAQQTWSPFRMYLEEEQTIGENIENHSEAT